MSKVSMFNIIFETKIKLERYKSFNPDNISKLKRNFLNVTGLDEKDWEVISDFPPIKDQKDFNKLLEALN